MGKTALIDADILRYEVGSVGQKLNKETGEVDILPFDFVKEVFDERIRTIINGSECDRAEFFLTADKRTYTISSRSGLGNDGRAYEDNFRTAIAKGKVYKGTRKADKPFHFYNLTAYILSKGLGEHTTVHVANGCEADDLMGIAACSASMEQPVVVCSRDKDLRMVPGTHYGWECGKQPEFGPVVYDDLGTIQLVRSKSGNKIVGGGFKFFCAQLLTGDVVDNIGGAKGIGPVKAYELLSNCTDQRNCFDTVRSTYQELDSDRWKELLEEQCSLLWIIRERNPDGSLKHFNIEEWLDGELPIVQTQDV